MMSIPERALSDLLEAEYRKQRAAAAERLHNAFAEIIAEQNPSVETVLYVLEALKAQLLAREVREHVEPAAPATRTTHGWREERQRRELGGD